jgi:hypothetical protein
MQADQGLRKPRASKQDHPHGGPICPLSDEEIAHWAPRLGSSASTHPNVRAARERRLRAVVTRWFDQASSIYRVRTLPPNWPYASTRTDEALPEIARRLKAIREELLTVPGPVTALLRMRYANYDLAQTALGALPFMLDDVAAAWHKPHSGHPKSWIEAEVIGLLIRGVELFTSEELPSPRSRKRQAEFGFVRLLSVRLLPELSDANFRTALGHWHRSRKAAIP